ncbi:FAD-dependent oxidoreductase, partial [Clostridium sp.]|uniref:FAD-dependent oxidoreductase n=1 Tax=Clostridium sp. TaxID=1506 RepID=UPI002900C5CB
ILGESIFSPQSGTISVEFEDGENEMIPNQFVLIATGSSPQPLPFLNFDHQVILSSDDILNMDILPDSIAIIGGGVIGLEFASYLTDLGVDVTIIEANERILPNESAQIAKTIKRELENRGAKFFENVVAEVMDRLGDYSSLKLRRALANSKMLSADVTAAYDPNYPSVMEKKNSAYFGKGLVFSKYTGARGKSGCNDANPEFMAWLRNVMDKNDVLFQTAELGKVDQGGGGTIAYILAEYNMEVIDCGVALQNMHAPWEVASKLDIYETMRGYKAFLEEELE